MRKACIIILSVLFCSLFSEAKKKQDIPAPYAWSITQPLGSRYDVPMDTLMHNFYSTDIPSSYSTAYGTTGNLGAAAFPKYFSTDLYPLNLYLKIHSAIGYKQPLHGNSIIHTYLIPNYLI